MSDHNPDGTDLGPVRATISITADRGRTRSRGIAFAGSGRWRGTMLAILVLAAAIGVRAIAERSHGAPRPSPASSLAAGALGTSSANTDHATTLFGVHVECPRLALVSPDGQYARADYERSEPCGTYGNYITLILHRVNGDWVQELATTGRRCPSSPLPVRVLVELELCPRSALGVSRSAPGGS